MTAKTVKTWQPNLSKIYIFAYILTKRAPKIGHFVSFLESFFILLSVKQSKREVIVIPDILSENA